MACIGQLVLAIRLPDSVWECLFCPFAILAHLLNIGVRRLLLYVYIVGSHSASSTASGCLPMKRVKSSMVWLVPSKREIKPYGCLVGLSSRGGFCPIRVINIGKTPHLASCDPVIGAIHRGFALGLPH